MSFDAFRLRDTSLGDGRRHHVSHRGIDWQNNIAMTLKRTKGKTSDQLLKDLESWKAHRFREFWGYLPTGSKQQAVISYDTACGTPDIADEINNCARNYAKQCETSQRFKKHASTWLNQADWETQKTIKQESVEKKSCVDCAEPATHTSPDYVCDKHWSNRYGTIAIDGEAKPYREVLQGSLERMNLKPKEGEPIEEWQERCREAFFTLVQRFGQGSPSLRQMAGGSRDDGLRKVSGE